MTSSSKASDQCSTVSSTDPAAQSVLRQLQLTQLSILRDVVELCEKHGVPYFLIGGTLLGAVRHKGFIPWDDDIDIAMYRVDYERFLEIAQPELGAKYFVQTGRTDPAYGRYIAKVRLNGTEFLEEEISHVPMHHGIFIDIFPLDEIPAPDTAGLALRGHILKFLARAWSAKIGMVTESRVHTLIRQIIRPFVSWMPGHWFVRAWDSACTATNGQGHAYVTSFASGYGWRKQAVLKQTYGSGRSVNFEGSHLTAPADSHAILDQLFGDYMTAPASDKRRGSHKVKSISFPADETNS